MFPIILLFSYTLIYCTSFLFLLVQQTKRKFQEKEWLENLFFRHLKSEISTFKKVTNRKAKINYRKEKWQTFPYLL